MSYQFNYTLPPLNAAAPKIDPDAPTYASEDGMVASLSSQECIFQIRRTGEPHVMTFQVLQAMDQCREFRTLEEHAARIQSTQPALSGKRDDVKRVLENLVQRQLLMSDSSFIERLGAAPATAQAPMRAVFIRACDRPLQLQNLLNSLVDYERRFRAGRRYVVLDDSVLPANIDEHRDLLREFARTTGCKVHYIGNAERQKIVEKLVRAFPQAKAVIAAMFIRDKSLDARRFGGGRGRNMAILLSAGARLGFLDDDLCLNMKRPPFARPGFDPNPAESVEAVFMANMEEAFDYGEGVDRDPFDLHLDACGQTLGALTCETYPLSRQALRGLSLSRLDLLSPNARIIATQLGTYGSVRIGTGHWLYQLEGRSRSEFWRDRESYLRNIEAQFVWYGVAQAKAREYTGFSPFTIDNTQLLPCTNPVARAEDVLWGALAKYAHPDSVIFEMPEAIGHLQETNRKRSVLTRQAQAGGINSFLRQWIQGQLGLYKAADPGQRLRLMADLLRDLGGAGEKERTSYLREYLSYLRADAIDKIQHQIEAAVDAPVYWQADARAIAEANAKALLAKAPPRLVEWSEDIDDAGCARALTVELNGMADCLEHWPALWRYAAEQGDKLLGAL